VSYTIILMIQQNYFWIQSHQAKLNILIKPLHLCIIFVLKSNSCNIFKLKLKTMMFYTHTHTHTHARARVQYTDI